ncbi:hypothetical protein KCM76_00340 [Zooshikella marina]|uniref:hypothetical protein n=1 Tax=Zooshikella ganghwensis TaxID=202772 RepID=UPI00041A12F1|nr:hypothetical protein [Zooshikella ganghwensis]MBU2704413.1 hypothetical protein [Zooshikella ganghwensis]
MFDESEGVMSGWIGVDLDGTLARYDRWRGPEHIGEPIKPMLERVKSWLMQGQEVRIFTARASIPEYIPHVERWLEKNGLAGLEITNVKDFRMIELWDDRCVQVMTNKGQPIRTKRLWRDNLRKLLVKL